MCPLKVSSPNPCPFRSFRPIPAVPVPIPDQFCPIPTNIFTSIHMYFSHFSICAELSDFEQSFEVHTDADRAIGGVLMQGEHPFAFESHKVNDSEQRYSTHEREMTTVLHCLRTWRHYLMGSKFIVWTGNSATSFFPIQK